MRWLLLICALLLAACQGGGGDVAIADLARDPESYQGREVTVRGTVVAFDAADGATRRHIAVEDAARNRVELLPISAAEPHVGRAVEVTGTFTFDPARGRAIEITTIEATADATAGDQDAG